MPSIRNFVPCLFHGAAAALMVLASASGHAQSYPSKPIRLILPTIPGSAFELMGRLMAKTMGDAMGQPIVAENRSGANGIGTPIENGRLRGDQIAFTAGGIRYAGRVNGDTLEGDATGGGAGAWSARRVSQ